jgi:hypothetical protein
VWVWCVGSVRYLVDDRVWDERDERESFEFDREGKKKKKKSILLVFFFRVKLT